MNAGQLDAVLAAARRGARENFGVDVEFTEPEVQSLSALLGRVTSRDSSRWNDLSYDFKGGKGDRARLVKGYAAALRSDENSSTT